VIGLDHPHVFSMAGQVVGAGAELAAFCGDGPAVDLFGKLHPTARRVDERDAILEDPSIHLVLGAGIPCERAPLGIEVMRHGKDFLSDKPAFTELSQLESARAVQAETGQIFSVFFSERFENQATVRASELVGQGAIGRVIQTIGLGPHRLNAASRPDWFFDPKRSGGTLNDLASHQIDQFLHFTGVTRPRIVSARVANYAHPEYPELEDFGEVLMEGEGATGYVRVDWFTPDGLSTWGDGRLTVLGTEGYLEVRKNVDIAVREGGSHLYLVDGAQTRYVDCSEVALPFAGQLLDDVVARSETAMSQEHCFLACELGLRAQSAAERVPAPRGQANP